MFYFLKSKITAFIFFTSAIIALLAVIMTASLLISGQTKSIHHQLQAAASGLVSLDLSDFSKLNKFDKMDKLIKSTLKTGQVNKIIRIFDHKKELVFSSIGIDYDTMPHSIIKDIEEPEFVTLLGSGTEKYETLIIPLDKDTDAKPLYLQVAIPLPKTFSILTSLWWQATILFLSLFLISIFSARYFSALLLKPVAEIANYLKTIDPFQMEKLPELSITSGSHYLNTITDGINMLKLRTQVAITHIRKMSRYVAHELRTPLTIIQGEAETALLKKDSATIDDYKNVLESSLEEVKRMSDIVDIVLSVGETISKPNSDKIANINLVDWSKKSLPLWERALGKTITTIFPENEEFYINFIPHLLFRLVDNLIRNIKKHTPAGTSCFVKIQKENEDISFIISDNGSGLSEEVVKSLNEEKAGSQHSHIGLHLCFRIAEMMNAKLIFANSNGLVVTLKIPLSNIKKL
ncbi:MAG: hypothetical protein COS89_02635 [Deltaproteobacteria bacterium CG07_land_8_20_14_0_80_38_7]|nr:MAG: hypothetical protein COS89_02635 [Deltaproteobacteria bacterium CG07_land_8_20_14_0_80_38_7]